MKITVLEKTEDTLRLLIEGAKPGLVNAIRRILLAETPTMAIDEVVILENQSPLFDETIAHRLGLIPLRTPKTYVMPEECQCGGVGCHLCQASFTLEVEAPEDGYIATTADLKPQDPEVVPVSDKIPIVKLARGQRVVLEAYARLGVGREHAKWQPVSTTGYKMVPHVEVDKERCDGCAECVKSCFKHVFEIRDEKAVVVNEMECTLCNLCVEACDLDAIRVTYDENSFIFFLESTGALPPTDILETGLDVFRKKMEKFIEAISPRRAAKAAPKRAAAKKRKPKADGSGSSKTRTKRR